MQELKVPKSTKSPVPLPLWARCSLISSKKCLGIQPEVLGLWRHFRVRRGSPQSFEGFLPEDRVNSILEEIEGGIGDNLWEELSKLDEKMLADLRKEHNQTVAVILAKVTADAVARVLPLMGEDRTVDIIERMVTIESSAA